MTTDFYKQAVLRADPTARVQTWAGGKSFAITNAAGVSYSVGVDEGTAWLHAYLHLGLNTEQLGPAHTLKGVAGYINELDADLKRLLQSLVGRTVRITVQEVLSEPDLPKPEDGPRAFEIWAEGWAATGDNGSAQLLGIGRGKTFLEACQDLANRKPEFAKQFAIHDGIPTHWGCRLFDNERLARASFG